MGQIIKLFRNRRVARLTSRANDGEWIAASDGRKIYLGENGKADPNSPLARGGLGRPGGKRFPKRCPEKKKIAPPYRAEKKTVKAMGEVIRSRAEQDCVFGGFYKVGATRTKLQERHIFFNPWTGEYFTVLVVDRTYGRTYGNDYTQAMRLIPINDEAERLYYSDSHMDSARYDAPGEESESPNVGSNHPNDSGGNNKRGTSHGNTRLPYGIAKSRGLDTTDMTPAEVWDMLKEEFGISAKESYKKLEKGEKTEIDNKKSKNPDKSTKAKVTSVKTYYGEEYKNVSGKKTTAKKKGDPEWILSGDQYAPRAHGAKADGYVRSKVQGFYTKEDMLYYLKEQGVNECTIDGETINPQEANLPKVVGGSEQRRFTKATIRKSGDKFSLSVAYMDGTTHRIGTEKTLEDAVKAFDNYGVKEKNITMPAEKSETKRTGWVGSKDGSYYTDGGTDIGKLSVLIGTPETGDGGMISGEDKDGKKHTKLFKTMNELMDFLKDNGVTKIDFMGRKDFNPADYDDTQKYEYIPKKKK